MKNSTYFELSASVVSIVAAVIFTSFPTEAAACITDADCAGPTPFCDVGTSTCVECLADFDCIESDANCGPSCVGNICSGGVDCTAGGQLCAGGGVCVDCVTDGDCIESDTSCGPTCASNVCSGTDCTASGETCDAGVCVVPTLSEWGTMGMSVLMLGGVLYLSRRRSIAPE